MLFNINIAILFCIIKWITFRTSMRYTHSKLKKCLFCFGFLPACWLVDIWWMSNLTNKHGIQTEQIWHIYWSVSLQCISSEWIALGYQNERKLVTFTIKKKKLTFINHKNKRLCTVASILRYITWLLTLPFSQKTAKNTHKFSFTPFSCYTTLKKEKLSNPAPNLLACKGFTNWKIYLQLCFYYGLWSILAVEAKRDV